MATASVELRNIAQGNDARTAHVRREKDGAIVVEGRDVGPVVREHFGGNARVYEWDVRIPADQVPALLHLLGRPGGDPLVAVAAWFNGKTRAFEPYLDAHGIVHESWSRVEG